MWLSGCFGLVFSLGGFVHLFSLQGSKISFLIMHSFLFRASFFCMVSSKLFSVSFQKFDLETSAKILSCMKDKKDDKWGAIW